MRLWSLIEQLHRQRTMSDGGSRPKRGRQHRGLSNFFPRDAGAFGCASVYIETIRTLGGARHRDRDQFAILPRDGAVVTPNRLVELYKGRKFRGPPTA